MLGAAGKRLILCGSYGGVILLTVGVDSYGDTGGGVDVTTGDVTVMVTLVVM